MAYFLFRHQPLQTFYYLYTALSLLFVRVPYWAVRYALPFTRPVPWSLGRVILVKCYRVLITTIFRTTVSTMCFDPVAVEKSGKADQVGLVWTEPAPDLIVLDEIKEAARINDIKPERTAGYWMGKRGPDGKVGQKAGPDEKVIYGFHGECTHYSLLSALHARTHVYLLCRRRLRRESRTPRAPPLLVLTLTLASSFAF